MNRRRRRLPRTVLAVAVVALLGAGSAACAHDPTPPAVDGPPGGGPRTAGAAAPSGSPVPHPQPSPAPVPPLQPLAGPALPGEGQWQTVVASHGLFVGPARTRLAALPLARVVVSDSVPEIADPGFPLERVRSAPALAAVIRRLLADS